MEKIEIYTKKTERATCRQEHVSLSVTRVFLASVVFMCVFLFLFVGVSESAEFVLQPSVTVQGNTVVLRDVVAVEGVLMSDDVLSITLGKAPLPGKKRHLSRAYILMKLKNNHVDLSSISVSGARGVNVKRESTVIRKEVIAEKVKMVISETYGFDPEHCVISFDNLKDELLLPQGEHEVRVTATRSGLRNGRFCFQLKVFSNGSEYLSKIISAQVLHRIPVLVAKKSIAARTGISSDDVVVEQRLLSDPRDFYQEISDITQMRTQVYISEGAEIKKVYLAAQPTIEKETVVSATVKNEGVSLVMPVIVKQSGMCGDVVTVYSASTRKHFQAIIRSETMVEVVL